MKKFGNQHFNVYRLRFLDFSELTNLNFNRDTHTSKPHLPRNDKVFRKMHNMP